MLNKSKGKQKTIKKDNLIVMLGIKISNKQKCSFGLCSYALLKKERNQSQ